MATRTISNTTGELYGVAVYGTSKYSISGQITVIPDGVQATGSLGSVNITATQFDYTTVANNYERRRTVFVHRRTTASDRTVKVA